MSEEITEMNNEITAEEGIMTSGSCSQKEAIAEALIFASGAPVKIESVAIAIQSDKKDAQKVLASLAENYNKRNGGIILMRAGNTYYFCSKPELRENLRDYFEKPSGNGLSRAAMETLSIICYNQPITRAGIEYVRGVNSDGVLVRLIEKDLVEEKGRSDAPGRPILYGTTNKFLQSLGVESIKDLPHVEKIKFDEKKTLPEEGKEEN